MNDLDRQIIVLESLENQTLCSSHSVSRRVVLIDVRRLSRWRVESMKSQFRIKLTIMMIAFAIMISFMIAIIDHMRLKEQVLDNNQFQVQQIEEHVEEALRNIEKAYLLFGENIAEKMESNSQYLNSLYATQPSFDEWDFQELKELLGLDIYIINDQNVITHSSFEEDIGLDFNVCCQKLAFILDQRRGEGSFYDDGIDIEQQTGYLKKYSYMATEDKKYMIQLGHTTIRREMKGFRLGGDEFAVLMPTTSAKEAEDMAQLLIEEIKAAITPIVRPLEEKVTLSIGIALAPMHAAYPEELYKRADLALYASKEKGKNQYRFFTFDLLEDAIQRGRVS